MNSARAALDATSWATTAALLSAWKNLMQGNLKPHGEDALLAQTLRRQPSAWCALKSQQVRSGQWRPGALQPLMIPKRNGGRRLLLVPPLADRIVLAALARHLQDNLDPLQSDAAHAYRPGRGTHSARTVVESARCTGRAWVWRGDVADCFDSISHASVVAALLRTPMAALAPTVLQALRAPLAIDAHHPAPRDMPPALAGSCSLWRGLPQGSPLSPLLCNLVLDQVDHSLSASPCVWVRYADDLLLLGHNPEALQVAQVQLENALEELGLRLNSAKTRLHGPGERFDYLGHTIGAAGLHTAADEGQIADASVTPGASRFASGIAVIERVGQVKLPANADGDDEESAVAELAEPLLRTLYLLEDNTKLARQGEALLVQRQGHDDLVVPGARIGQVLAFGATHLSSGAISLCLERGIPVMLLSGRGRHFGCIDPIQPPSLPLLQRQLALLDDEGRRLGLAQTVIKAKIANTLLVLRRWARRRPNETLHTAILQLQDARHRVARMTSATALRGLEGSVAAASFGALASILPAEWEFETRKRQPPPDPINSLLSYGYTLLYYNTLTLVLGRGLQPHLGLLHQPRAGHHALVSDLMEPFRPLVVDALVADLALNGSLRPGQFNRPEQEGEPCLMSPEARRRFIEAFERKMNTKVECPALNLRLDARRLIDLQTLQLAEVLQGRLQHFQAWVAR